MKCRMLLSTAVCLAGLALGVASPPQVRAAGNGTGVPLYDNNIPDCALGGSPTPITIGFVNFHLRGGALDVNVHLHGAAPDATYYIVLHEACAVDDIMGAITTNVNGVGNGHLSAPTGESVFTLQVYSPDTSDTASTPLVSP